MTLKSPIRGIVLRYLFLLVPEGLFNQLKIEAKTENFPNSVSSRRGREQLKINFTTATLFKVSSNLYVTVLCVFSAVNHLLFSFFRLFFIIFAALKLKDIRIP